MNSAPNWPEGTTRRAALNLLGGLILLAMIPENPVVGGNVLRRAAIQSPNFVTTVSGWSINQDGSAEFNNIVIRNGQIISGTQFSYSSLPPALGNLVASFALVFGTDSVGNAYVPGYTVYNKVSPTDFQATSINGAKIQFWTAGGAGGPWSNVFTMSLEAGEVSVQFASNATGNSISVGESAQALKVIGGMLADLATISGSAAAGPLLQVTNAVSDTAPVVRVQVVNPVSQQLFFGGLVAGDTNARIILDVAAGGNPRVRWGPGNASPDIILSRTAANLLSLVSSDLDISTIGRGLQIAEGTNARMGRAVLVAGAVTVANTSVTANTEIFLTCQINNGISGFLRVSGRVPGTSFSIVSSSSSDTSTVGWLLVEPG